MCAQRIEWIRWECDTCTPEPKLENHPDPHWRRAKMPTCPVCGATDQRNACVTGRTHHDWASDSSRATEADKLRATEFLNGWRGGGGLGNLDMGAAAKELVSIFAAIRAEQKGGHEVDMGNV